jgi:hypothetical protein
MLLLLDEKLGGAQELACVVTEANLQNVHVHPPINPVAQESTTRPSPPHCEVPISCGRTLG